MTLHGCFSEIWSMSLTASIVIAVVLAARLLLHRAPKVFSYALWAVVLFRLLCPVTLAVPHFGMMTPELPVSGVEAVYDTTISDETIAEGDSVQVPPSGRVGDVGVEVTTALDRDTVWTVLGSAWACGVAAMLTLAVVQTVRLRRRLVGAVCLRENIWLADHIDSPFVMGAFRPRIYLPSSLGEAEQEYILLHERHHIHRGDHVTRMLAYAALCLHWFNPLVWVAFHVSGKDMEMSCDEAVLRKMEGDIRADYGASLLRLATGKRAVVGSPLAFGEGDTGSRVKHVLRYRKPVLWVIVAAVCVVAVLGVFLALDRQSTAKSLLGTEYHMETRLFPDLVVAYGDLASAHRNEFLCEYRYFYLDAERQLFLSHDDRTFDYMGQTAPYELSERMQELIGCKVTEAYILRLNAERFMLREGDFLLFLRTRSGETLYAFGWEDVSERDDYHSDDSELYVLYEVEATPIRNAELYSWLSTGKIPASITLERYIDGSCVAAMEITAPSEIWEWYRQTKWNSNWIPMAAYSPEGKYDDGFVIRWNYPDAIDGVTSVEGCVWRVSEDVYLRELLLDPPRDEAPIIGGGGELYAELDALFPIT